MPILADAHVHIYPSYKLEVLFDSALSNLSRYTKTTDFTACLFLSERSDCNEFEKLISRVQSELNGKYEAQSSGTGTIRITRITDKRSLFVFAGRQIATQEGLEVLSLFSNTLIPDKLNLDESITRVKAAGGLPVLNWAPGKWFSKRGDMIAAVLNRSTCENLLLCDTTLRPILWRDPAQFDLARSKKIRVLAGSDPLPQDFEEKLVGRYGISIEGELDNSNPVAGIKTLLLNPKVSVEKIGVRPDPISWLIRYLRFMVSK